MACCVTDRLGLDPGMIRLSGGISHVQLLFSKDLEALCYLLYTTWAYIHPILFSSPNYDAKM